MSERKTVLITGSSRGIGAATARLFYQRGYDVGIHYHNSREEAARLAAQLGTAERPVGLYQADVADRAQVEEMVAAFLREFGRLDVLVCCAGMARQELFTDITEDSWQEMMAVNLDGVYRCCQAALKGDMLHRKDGAIITVSSMWGQVGASCEVAYSTAKAGIIGLTKALAKELGPSHIRVNCVAPGVIQTDMNRNLTAETMADLQEETPLGVLGTPEDVAESIFFLTEEGGRFYTGQVLSPNGGFVI